ncbi:hypothetical protein Tsubulata_012990 [Turnera subulata]|uniref:Uncharacterized protein n=1 Tax=Turnera subulata TaxID=218843 RepID=A0A9Q0FAH1_9ROSI|nr:hypothetical protein Tsubulata_012990 [Turnera subulata]
MDSLTLKPTFNSFLFNPAIPKAQPLSHSINSSLFKFRNFTKLGTSRICFSYRNPPSPQNPKPRRKNYSFLPDPLWVLVLVLQRVKGLASSQTKKWVSRLQAYSDEAERAISEYNGSYAQSGAFGLALLSITSNAKVKISPFVATLGANPTFMAGLWAWFMAQSMKVVLNFFVERKWDFRILCASGGMPSSHSALCTALTTSVAFCHGVADSLFPVCLGFSLIVMYDAIGVRRHAGMQAEVLNLIVEDLFQGHPISQRKLKELLGHTPSQVFAGAMLGILVACVCCQGCLVAT